jgi:hypothetical protein
MPEGEPGGDKDESCLGRIVTLRTHGQSRWISVFAAGVLSSTLFYEPLNGEPMKRTWKLNVAKSKFSPEPEDSQ